MSELDAFLTPTSSDEDLLCTRGVDGRDTMHPAKRDTLPTCIVRAYAGLSLAGIGANQIKKVNQDALLM